MKKTLFYTVTKETIDVGGFEECNGLKTINVYKIIKDKPKLITSIDTDNELNSEDVIQDWLDDNKFEDESFEFNLL